MSECPICIEKYTKRDRKKIECVKCGNLACVTCCKNYILGSINEAHCMGCKNPWDRKFLVDNFTYKFVSEDYKTFLENILYDREKSNMGEAYRVLDAYNKADDMEKELDELKLTRSELTRKIRDIDSNIYSISYNVKQIRNGKYTINNEKSQYKFFGHCPRDNCRGVITEKIKCNVCNQRVCKSCKEPIGDGVNDLKLHSCNPDTLETIKSIKDCSKPCPKCKVSIYKIDGCNQMFCTQCNISFCWRTGEIYKGRNIHNPHYFEWLNNGGATGATGAMVDGGGMCNGDGFISTFIRRSGYRYRYQLDRNRMILYDNLRTFIDISRRIIPTLRDKTVVDDKILNSKVDYLNGYIDDNKLKKIIQDVDIKVHRLNENINILESLVSGFSVIIRDMFGDSFPKNLEDSKHSELNNNIENLIRFSETLSSEFRKKYKTRSYILRWKDTRLDYDKKTLIEIVSV